MIALLGPLAPCCNPGTSQVRLGSVPKARSVLEPQGKSRTGNSFAHPALAPMGSDRGPIPKPPTPRFPDLDPQTDREILHERL